MSDLALRPPRPGFRVGLSSVFRGIGWVVTTPAVWPLAFVPMLVALVIMVGLGITTVYLVPGWVEAWIGPASSLAVSVLVRVAQLAGVLLGFLVSILTAFALAQPLSGPALESLVKKQEQALGAPVRPGNNFLVDVWRSLQSLLVGYMLGLPILAVLALASFLFPPAAVVLVPLKLLVASFMVAWDLCDYPLSIRGLRVADRLAIMARYKGTVFGFGVALALAGLVPGLLFLLLPCGVAGAARVMWEIERFERSEGRPLGGGERGALPPA
jgi:CysZ protein